MIKSIGLALAAVLALAAAPAFAADPPPAPDMKIDPAKHTQGQKEVPAIVATAGVPCTVTDGYFGGEGDSKDEAGKPTKVKIYEAACKEGIGYLFVVPTGGAPKNYDCISMGGGGGCVAVCRPTSTPRPS